MRPGIDNARVLALAVTLCGVVSGCAIDQIPEEALRLEETTLETRSVLALGLAASLVKPIDDSKFGVFRM